MELVGGQPFLQLIRNAQTDPDLLKQLFADSNHFYAAASAVLRIRDTTVPFFQRQHPSF
jgi:hypothetical protein